MTTATLVGHGPSRTVIVSCPGKDRIIRKHFPAEERDRLAKEVAKLRLLRGTGGALFYVPEVLDVGELHYDLEFIPNAKNLAEAIPRMRTCDVADNLTAIVGRLRGVACLGNSVMRKSEDLWGTMIGKFSALEVLDDRAGNYGCFRLQYSDVYFELLNRGRPYPRLTLGYSHGDLSFDNILVDGDGRWVLIDPVWSEVESPLWDVGKIFQSTAANWEGIKKFGCALPPSQRAATLNEDLVHAFRKAFTGAEMLLGTACQLARVARWCYPDVLVPLVVKLLRVYLDTDGDNDACCDALRRLV